MSPIHVMSSSRRASPQPADDLVGSHTPAVRVVLVAGPQLAHRGEQVGIRRVLVVADRRDQPAAW